MNTNTEVAPATEQVLPDDVIRFIKKWKGKPGNLIMILHRVQEHFGFIPREAAFEVSHLTDVPVAKIYGVITFYHLFKLEKPGDTQIQVCMGTACYLKGGEDLIFSLERELNCAVNCTTEDGKFSVESVRCIGCCGLAPVMAINGEVFGHVKNEELTKILAKYRD